jgi:hypothetical protein
MSRREIRVALTLAALVLAACLSQLMTFNRLTPLGWTIAAAVLVGALLAEPFGWWTRTEWVAWLGPVCALLCLVIAALFTFAPPQSQPGFLVDTSDTWERHERARSHTEIQNP